MANLTLAERVKNASVLHLRAHPALKRGNDTSSTWRDQMTNFNFDFSALPAAPVRGGVEPELVGVFAALVNAAPRALGIKEIIAVAAASGVEVPAETTVRTYLNRAAEDGRITKPTRRTYAGAAVEGEAAVSEDAGDAVEGDDDPLAGL